MRQEGVIELTEMIKTVATFLGYVMTISAALGAMYGWIAKPIKGIRAENAAQSAMLRGLDEDTADLLCSQLIREHDYYLQKGWCSASDKQRLDNVYTRYKKRGRNHIADTYINDIAALPEHAPDYERR